MGDNTELVKAPRLCRIEKEHGAYGFNLHGEKGVVGQYISAVDEGGPAECAGLSVGDRLVEVNGENVEKATHAIVVNTIKQNENFTELLVIDRITDNYMKDRGMLVTADLVRFASVADMSETEKIEAEEVNKDEPHVTENIKNDVDAYDTADGTIQELKPEEVEINTPQENEYATVGPPREDSVLPVTDTEESADIPQNTKPLDNIPQTENIIEQPANDNAIITSKHHSKVPQRNKVKDSHKGDWKAKQHLFNNL